MAEIKAVIFDLDGVLVDASAWHYRAFSRALREHGVELTPEEHARRYEGLPTREKLKLLSAEKGLPAGLHGAINGLKQRYTAQLIAEHCRPRREHVEMLSALKAERYRLAVASNSIRKTIELVLSSNGLLGYLDFYLSNEDVIKSKPDPEVYLAAFARLGLRPAECLVLEDHPAGLKAAYASGAHVAEVKDISAVSYSFVRSHIDDIEQGRK